MAKPEEKIVKIVDEAIHTRGVSIDQLSEWGSMAIFIVAEDADDPGVYYPIQGQFDDNGNFGLVGAGSGSSTITNYRLTEADNSRLTEDDNNRVVESA